MIATAPLPSDLEPLEIEGFFAHAQYVPDEGIKLSLYRVYGERVNIMPVCEVRFPTRYPSRWNLNPIEIKNSVALFHPSAKFGPAVTRSWAEVLGLAANLCETLNESIADKIKAAEEAARLAEQERERQRAEYEERRKRERAEWERQRQERLERQRQANLMREARAKHLLEEIKWMIGDKIRLTRDGKRATVFGTIDNVIEAKAYNGEIAPLRHRMWITTEKNVRMDIILADINKLEVKYPDDKRYTLIYKAGMEPKPELTTNEQKGSES